MILRKRGAVGELRLAARVTDNERAMVDEPGDDKEAGGRKSGCAKPAGSPIRAGGEQYQHQRRRNAYSQPDAAEMQRLKIAAAGGGEMRKDDA